MQLACFEGVCYTQSAGTFPPCSRFHITHRVMLDCQAPVCLFQFVLCSSFVDALACSKR